MCSKLNIYLEELNNWFISRGLKLSPSKSTATLFSTWTKEIKKELNIIIDGKKLPTVNNPKILGIIFDSMLTFNAHATSVAKKMQNRNNALKNIAGCTWGKSKEELLISYKAIGRPLLNYAAGVWTPQLAESHWGKLQACQNAALRTATGCYRITDQSHLHRESQILPVKAHNQMLSKQALLACYKHHHPNNDLVHRAASDRRLRKTLTDMKPSILNITKNGNIDETVYKDGLKKIHSAAVVDATGKLSANRVLNCEPPDIAPEEKGLPRKTRSTLSQLRAGWSSMLRHYMNRIDKEVKDECPDCGATPHDTRHLFECPRRPTTLTPESLWTEPVAAAAFLELPT